MEGKEQVDIIDYRNILFGERKNVGTGIRETSPADAIEIMVRRFL